MIDQDFDPWQSHGLPFLNIASTCAATQVLGPGWRAAIWVQGCPLNCAGCIAPDWIPLRLAHLVRPKDIVDELLQNPEITGLTFSGGEPMLQAAGLAEVACLARQQRNLSIICFTGMRLEHLREQPSETGIPLLLSEIDVLIDGPYVASLNDDRGLRGSRNQRFHYLTARLKSAAAELEYSSRAAEVHLRDGEALLVGVPPVGVLDKFHHAVTRAAESTVAAVDCRRKDLRQS